MPDKKSAHPKDGNRKQETLLAFLTLFDQPMNWTFRTILYTILGAFTAGVMFTLAFLAAQLPAS